MTDLSGHSFLIATSCNIAEFNIKITTKSLIKILYLAFGFKHEKRKHKSHYRPQGNR